MLAVKSLIKYLFALQSIPTYCTFVEQVHIIVTAYCILINFCLYHILHLCPIFIKFTALNYCKCNLSLLLNNKT